MDQPGRGPTATWSKHEGSRGIWLVDAGLKPCMPGSALEVKALGSDRHAQLIRSRPGVLTPKEATRRATRLRGKPAFIWGPPGTGKTKTIGTIGEQLWRASRSALMVSHTNAAVDQALLHIADALGEEAEDGSVLRLGEPNDLRLLERPRLLAETHIEERAAILEAEEAQLQGERGIARVEIRDLRGLIELAHWVARGAAERQQWLTTGLESGRPDDCDTFND
jgi:hypothetical protein